MITERRGRLATFSVLFFLLIFSSCRFKAPSAVEGEALISGGTFPGAVPSWVMQSKNSRRQPVADAGIVPQTYSAPQAVEATRLSVPNPNVPNPLEEEPEKERLAMQQEEAKAAQDEAATAPTVSETERKETSPLDRIVKVCPGTEPAVKEALQTSERRARIQKYEKLTTRCPQSWDLWLWLGKDYESEGRLAEAGRSYERVLNIDYNNEVAQALLSNVRKRLTEQNQKKK